MSSSPRPARPDRMFGIKDVFTTINAMGGVVAICLCVDGRPFAAGVAMLLGYLCGDTVDGWIARKLGTSNQFGAEYDTIADHLSHCIAPGAIVYTVYRQADLGMVDWQQQVLAIALGGSIMVTASIRHARNIVQPIEVKGIWVGLPRTVLGFICVAYADANLFHEYLGGLWFGLVLIPAACVAALTHWPFPSHRMARGHFGHVKFFIALTFGTLIASLIWRPEYIFDVLFFWMLGYSLTAWLSMTKDERVAYWAKVRTALAAPTA